MIAYRSYFLPYTWKSRLQFQTQIRIKQMMKCKEKSITILSPGCSSVCFKPPEDSHISCLWVSFANQCVLSLNPRLYKSSLWWSLLTTSEQPLTMIAVSWGINNSLSGQTEQGTPPQKNRDKRHPNVKFIFKNQVYQAVICWVKGLFCLIKSKHKYLMKGFEL